MSDAATLDVLIQIREELAGLTRTRDALKTTKQEAESLGAIFRQGLGIGTGMAVATAAVGMLKNSLISTVGQAFRLSEEITDQSEALGITAEAYQVLRFELAQAGVESARLSIAVSTQTTSMAEARDSASAAAAAYRTLGLDLATIEALPFEQRLEQIVRATLNAKDQTTAYQAASVLLGSRGLPQLLASLRGVATEGFGGVAAASKAAGRVLADETVASLDKAKQAWDNFTGNTLPVAAGRAVGWLQSAMDGAGETAANLLNLLQGRPLSSLSETAPPPKTPRPTITDPVALAQTGDWRAAELALMQSQNREQIAAASNTLSEAASRRRLTSALEDQIYAQSQLLRLAQAAPITPQETQADRDKQIEQLKTQITLLHQRKAAAEKGPTTRAARASFDFKNINNPDENPDYMTGMEGLKVGAQEFFVGLGSMGQQTAAILQGSLGAAMNSLGNDIWEAQKGTQSWSAAFTNLGDIAGRMLTQIIVQMMVVKALNMALGVFGYGITGGGGATISKVPAVTAAGGGSFVTNGLTHFTVGDNPGGRERVTVEPLSGVGRSTINGQAIRMAGGGSAIVNSSGTSGSGARPIIVNQVLNVAAGVAQTVRAELMGLMPTMRALAVDATREALARGEA